MQENRPVAASKAADNQHGFCAQEVQDILILTPVLLQDAFILHILLAEEMGQGSNNWRNFLGKRQNNIVVDTKLMQLEIGTVIWGFCSIRELFVKDRD